MGRGRVVLVTAKPILGSIVRDVLASDPYLEIVGVTGDWATLKTTLLQSLIDVLVIDVGNRDPLTVQLDLPETHSSVPLLLLGEDGRIAVACRGPRRQALGEVSPAGLRQAVRGLCQPWALPR